MDPEESIVDRIGRLVDEQDRLREGDPSPDERARIDKIDTQLNQCWDLLRQRRARAETGDDPGAAQVRDSTTVDNYLN